MAFGFIDFAKEVLEASDRPLSVEEMWETDGSWEPGRFHERELHILLSSVVCADEHFKCMTKTIYHEVYRRKGETAFASFFLGRRIYLVKKIRFISVAPEETKRLRFAGIFYDLGKVDYEGVQG